MFLLSNMALDSGTVAFFWSLAIFSGFFTHMYWGLIFCFAKPLTRKCSTKILRLRVAKLQLNFGILSQNCDCIFLLISSPVIICCFYEFHVVTLYIIYLVINSVLRTFWVVLYHDPLKDRCIIWQLWDFYEPIEMCWFIKQPMNLLHFV